MLRPAARPPTPGSLATLQVALAAMAKLLVATYNLGMQQAEWEVLNKSRSQNQQQSCMRSNAHSCFLATLIL